MLQQILHNWNREGLLLSLASCIVSLCVAAVLSAVFINFALASRSEEVKHEKKSPIATGTMLLFLLGHYQLIHRRIGVLSMENVPLRTILVIVGLLLVIVGCMVNLLGRFRLGKNWANQVTVYERQTLVTTGIFGLVRHPLYASLIWMFYGASLVYQNYAAFLATTFVFVPMMFYRARQEETLLEQEFPKYREYRKEVGMLFPCPKGKVKNDR